MKADELDSFTSLLQQQVREMDESIASLQREREDILVRAEEIEMKYNEARRYKERLDKIVAAAATVRLPGPVRQQVLREQAMRARLSKSDMSPGMRLKCLQEGEKLGVLTAEEAAELADRTSSVGATPARRVKGRRS